MFIVINNKINNVNNELKNRNNFRLRHKSDAFTAKIHTAV